VRTDCPYCKYPMESGNRCLCCGAISEALPLASFLNLLAVDKGRLQAFLAAESDDDFLAALAFLSLREIEKAAPILRRLVRAEGPGSRAAALEREVRQHNLAIKWAKAVVARDRGLLGDRRIVLSIDDSPTVRRVMELTLERVGHFVVSVEDAELALERLSELRPDIIFVDLQLPGIDGFELCAKMRAEPTTRGIPVVVISGKAVADREAKSLRVGADAFLAKPTNPEILLGVVERLTLPRETVELELSMQHSIKR